MEGLEYLGLMDHLMQEVEVELDLADQGREGLEVVEQELVGLELREETEQQIVVVLAVEVDLVPEETVDRGL
jgi:hypothetical protein